MQHSGRGCGNTCSLVLQEGRMKHSATLTSRLTLHCYPEELTFCVITCYVFLWVSFFHWATQFLPFFKKNFWILPRYEIIGSKNINILKLMWCLLSTFFPKMYRFRLSIILGSGYFTTSLPALGICDILLKKNNSNWKKLLAPSWEISGIYKTEGDFGKLHRWVS